MEYLEPLIIYSHLPIGFYLTKVSHILTDILRPAILTAYIGYILAILRLLVDLGRPYNIWHAIIYWQHHSVMFEVAWCVMLYTTILTLKFLPILFEKFKWYKLLHLMKKITIPIVITGIILSTLHQSSLGSLFLIVPHKLLPLWYSPLLSLFFFITAVIVGLAMIIFEANLSAFAFRKAPETYIVTALAKTMFPLIIFYILLRILDITIRNAWIFIFQHHIQGTTFLIEMELIIIPIFILQNRQLIENPTSNFICAIFVISGVILNRLNVLWFGMLPSAEKIYTPSWQEVFITLNLISFGVVMFALAARYLPLFDVHHNYQNENL